MNLQEIIDKARAKFPYWCELSKKGGPDPRVIDHTLEFGHFIRFPRVGEENNVWCFEQASFRDHFCTRYGAKAVDHEE